MPSLIDLVIVGVWAAVFLYSVVSFTGYLCYDAPAYKTSKAVDQLQRCHWNPNTTLIVSFISYGDQQEVLINSVRASLSVLEKLKLTFEIELVTDLPITAQLPPSPHIVTVRVPKEYVTKNGAEFKGRALQFGLEERQRRHKDLSHIWILQMDEESILTKEAVAGVYSFISDPCNKEVIGQGEIQYNSNNYLHSFITTLLDSYRTGEDLGRYRFQFHALKSPYWGVRGSFLLVPASVAARVGYDHPSLTEDVYFALKAATMGIKFGWVEGVIQEQSPKNLKDLIGQRRRWLSGLKTMTADNSLPLWIRATAFLNPACWRLSMISLGLFSPLLWHYQSGLLPDAGKILCFNLWGAMGSSYVLGAYRNAEGLGFNYIRRILLCLLVGATTPIACLVESLIFFYGLSSPAKRFHVIRKEYQLESSPHE
jgi:cellulose synthase/poly-beta-1,6-N-acetylglucosamine synthase-like glycosyltransferase